jgi:hypothetical protein
MRHRVVESLSLVLVVSLLVACTGNAPAPDPDPDPDSAPDLMRTYQGPGSRWEAVLGEETFTFTQFPSATASNAILTVSGTSTQNAINLFRTFTVQSVESNDGPAPVPGDTAVGLEIPGTALFLRAPGSATPLVLVDSACPTADAQANWVITKPELNPISGGFPGRFDTDGAGAVAYTHALPSITVRSAGIIDGVLSSGDDPRETLVFGSAVCANGVVEISQDVNVFDLYFTASGNVVVKFPDTRGEQIIVALPQRSVPVDAAALAGTYSVMVYQGGSATNLANATLVEAELTFDSNAVASMRLIDEVESNTLGANLGTLTGMTLTDDATLALPHGMVRFTLGGDLTGQVTCALSTATPKVIACHGFKGTISDTDPNPWNEPITVIGRSR